MDDDIDDIDADIEALPPVATLRRLGACWDARRWAAGRQPEEAWISCPELPWMLWLLGRVGLSRRALKAVRPWLPSAAGTDTIAETMRLVDGWIETGTYDEWLRDRLDAEVRIDTNDGYRAWRAILVVADPSSDDHAEISLNCIGENIGLADGADAAALAAIRREFAFDEVMAAAMAADTGSDEREIDVGE